MNPLWNLFFGNSHCGDADGDCKEDVERVAREELGQNVDADLQREPVDVPVSHGWWNERDSY
jgi:hypothetical protein